MAMVAASPPQPSPSTRQITTTTTSRIGPGRSRPRRRDADQPPSASSSSSSSPRRVPQPRSASLEQSDGLTEPEEPEDKLKEALRRSASGRDGPPAATPQRPPRLTPSRSTKSKQTPKQAAIYDVNSPLVEASSSSSLQAATSSPSSASHQAFQERFDRLRARLRQTDAAKASQDGDAASAPRRASSLKSTSTILARLEERRRLQTEQRLSASPDDVESQSRDTGAPSSSPSPRRRPRSYHARASSEDLSPEPSSSSSPSPEASPPTSLLRRRNTYTDASPPARSPLGVARRVSNSARPAIDEAGGDKKKTSESSPPMLQMPESLRSQRDTSTASAAPPSRRHVQRLLNSERGADNAGNSPRKQPTSDVTITLGVSSKGEAQGTTTTPAVASPTFLERARAARALQASQAEAAAAAKRMQRAEEVERGDRESSDNGGDQRRPLATLRKKPSLLQQQLVASPSSPPAAVSREDEEDEAAVELQLTPESSPTPARRKATAEASPSSPSPASSRSLSSSPLPRSSSRQPDARRVRAALLAAKGEYSPRRAEATAVDDVAETPVRRSFAAAAAVAKPVSSSRLAPQLDKSSMEEGAVNNGQAKRSTTPTMAPPTSNAPRRFLKGVAVLVDVRDADGRDLSYQYVDLLRSHGAKVASRCPSADSRRQLTHIVWRQGKPSTLRYLKGLLEEGADDASVAVVSVDWVTRCVEAGRRVTEEDHLVEVGRQAVRYAQDHREKQRQKRRSSMLPSRGSADQIQSLLSTASSSKSLGLGLDVVTRLAAKHCPEVGSPLRWEIQLQEEGEGGEERRES